MSNSRKVICYDLDSTMFDVQHREHLAPEAADRFDTQNWIDYSKACVSDTLVAGIAASARLFFYSGFLIHFVSGRNVEAYKETIASLDANNVPWSEVRLHSQDDLRHNGEYKAAYINELKERGLIPVLMFEDHIVVCEMIEERTGVPCISVQPRYADTVGVAFNLNEHSEWMVK